jgi:hypothetical protein
VSTHIYKHTPTQPGSSKLNLPMTLRSNTGDIRRPLHKDQRFLYKQLTVEKEVKFCFCYFIKFSPRLQVVASISLACLKATQGSVNRMAFLDLFLMSPDACSKVLISVYLYRVLILSKKLANKSY